MYILSDERQSQPRMGGSHMEHRLVTSFDTISHRVIYSLNLMYSPFAPARFGIADEKGQRALHTRMGKLIDKLYKDPGLLELTAHADEAYQLYEINNMRPELDKTFASIFRELYEFYKFLYIAALHGETSASGLLVSLTVLKANKAGFKPQYARLLHEVGIHVGKSKSDVEITADNGDGDGDGLLKSLRLLAAKVPTNVNKWMPYLLANFACCSFTGDFGYLLPRTDSVCNLGGMLPGLHKRCLAAGYAPSVDCSMTATNLALSNYLQEQSRRVRHRVSPT